MGEDKKTFEDIEVELESTDNCPGFTLRTMLIHHAKVNRAAQRHPRVLGLLVVV